MNVITLADMVYYVGCTSALSEAVISFDPMPWREASGRPDGWQSHTQNSDRSCPPRPRVVIWDYG